MVAAEKGESVLVAGFESPEIQHALQRKVATILPTSVNLSMYKKKKSSKSPDTRGERHKDIVVVIKFGITGLEGSERRRRGVPKTV